MKKCLIELVGSYFLVMTILLTGNPIAIGMVLTTMLIIGMHISGGYFNPIISTGAVLQHKLTTHSFLKYTAFQLIGTLLALGLFRLITGSNFVPDLTAGLSEVTLFVIEASLSFLLCLIAFDVTNKNTTDTFHGAIAIGFACIAIYSIGGLFNPLIIVASLCYQALTDGISMQISQIIIQMGAPFCGSIGAHYFYKFLKN